MNRSVLRERCAASARDTYPRSAPTGYAVSANPIAATLEKLCVGQRSGVRPVFGLLWSQNQLKVLCSRVSRNAVWRGVSEEGGIGPLIPVIDVALVDADATSTSAAEYRLSISRKLIIEVLCRAFNYSFGQSSYQRNRRWLRFLQPAPIWSCGHSTANVRHVELG